MIMPLDEKQLKKKLEEQKVEALKAKLEASPTFKMAPNAPTKSKLIEKKEAVQPFPVDPNLSRKDNLSNYLKAELGNQGKKTNEKIVAEKTSDSLKEQLSSIKQFVAKGLLKSSGEMISQESLKGLNAQEILEVRKLVRSLADSTKLYTKKEIFEAMILEKKSKKVAMAVIQNLYPQF